MTQLRAAAAFGSPDQDGKARVQVRLIELMGRPRRVVPLAEGIVGGIQRAGVMTVPRFARGFRVSRRTLERRCDERGTTAGDCVDFISCGQVVSKTTGPWDPDVELTACCADPRTRRHLIERGGLDGPVRPSFDEFLDKQTILTTRSLVEEIRAAWRRATIIFLCVGAYLSEVLGTAMMPAI